MRITWKIALTTLFTAAMTMAATTGGAQAADYYITGGGGGSNNTNADGGGGGGGGASYWGENTGSWGAGAGGNGATDSAASGGGGGGNSLQGGTPNTDGTDATTDTGAAGASPISGAGLVGIDGDNRIDPSTGGKGGNGGAALTSGSISNPNNGIPVDFDSPPGTNIIVGGGNGGNSGNATNGGTSGAGGNGGVAAAKLSGATAFTGKLTMNGGTGGNAGTADSSSRSVDGGDGGGSYAFTARDVTLKDVEMTAGAGGADGSGAGTLGTGGKGGEVSFYAPDNTVTLTGTFDAKNSTAATAAQTGGVLVRIQTLKSGDDAAAFNAASLYDATGRGAYTINIGKVDATTNNITLNFTSRDVTGIDTVNIGDLVIGSGKQIAFAGADDGTEFTWTGNLTVNAVGNTGGTLSNGDLNATGSGKTITFVFDENTDGTGTGLLTISSGSITVDAGTNIAIEMAATTALRETDTVTLVSGGLSGGLALDGRTVNTTSGAYDIAYTLGSTGTDLTATMDAAGSGLNEGVAHNALMSASALMQLVVGGGDVSADMTGKFSPMDVPAGDTFGGIQFGAFVQVGGGRVKVDTGSHIKSNNFHLMVGPGVRFNHGGSGKTDLGVFFESGWGNYDTYNSIYRGDGDSRYYGAGLLLRHDTCFGLYGEASFRVGSAKSDFDGVGGYRTTAFDMKSTYYGGHLGLGYIFKVSEVSSFDISAKGLWTHVDDDTATNGVGDRMFVDDTDSFRSQLAVKYNYNQSI